MSPSADSLVLIVNPAAGRGRAASAAEDIVRLLGRGNRTETRFSDQPGGVHTSVAAAIDEGFKRIVVAGGDGTVHEAINAIVSKDSDAALGVVPVGTGNDFVKAAGIPLDWKSACERIVRDQQVHVDIGRCNDTFFGNGIGVGLDARIVEIAKDIRWLKGFPVYVAALARCLVDGVDTTDVSIEWDHGSIVQPVTLVAVANGHCYGGGFRIAPPASIRDGVLDVVIADAVTRLKALQFVPRVMRGTHMGTDIVRHETSRHVRIRAGTELPVQIDGETRRMSSLDIEVLPGRLRLMV